jgi:peptidoglycan/LPS O-acetylase OafA/YrhL
MQTQGDPAAAPGAERIAHLDALRGLAALAVVWSHFVAAYRIPRSVGQYVTNTPLHALWDGPAAVSFFFVLSGLVLTRRYFVEPARFSDGRFSLAGFCASRVCRIWLPLLAVLVLSWAAWATVFQPGLATVPPGSRWLQEHWVYQVTPGRFLYEAMILLPRRDPRLIPQDWTLTAELSVSFLIPLMVWLALRRVSWLVFFGAVLILVFRLPGYLLHFVLGILLAHSYDRVGARVAALGTGGRLALGIAALLLYSFRYTVPPRVPGVFGDNAIWAVTAFGAAGIIALFAGSPGLRRAFSGPKLLWLGRISYSLYLCHFLVLMCAMPWVLRTLEGLALGNGMAVRLLALALFSALSVLLAAILYEWVEAPSTALGRRLERRLRARGGASAARVPEAGVATEAS